MRLLNIKKDKEDLSNKLKIAGIAGGLGSLLSLIGIGAVSIYTGLRLVKPKRVVIKELPNEHGLEFEEITFKSKHDNTLLKGWWIPAKLNGDFNSDNKTVIFAHGYGNNRGVYSISVIKLAKRLCMEGYNVLVFDFRASGESEGKYVTIGKFEKYDLLSAIDFVVDQRKSINIHLIGWSMGAATSILAGAESKYVKCVIADSPFGNLKEYLNKNLSYWSGLPNIPFRSIILGVLPKTLGIDIKDVDTVKAAEKFKGKPLFLIHSKDDSAIPYEESIRIFEVLDNKESSKLWITEKAEHIRSYLVYKDEYEDNIVDFLNKN